ncbi:MAG TPA: hypothetical protein VFE53_23205 [Mucilaginibacter sp.]|jgi:hypothetical protein|nr:hypothetical protein [Mucilaginibacter sp.]
MKNRFFKLILALLCVTCFSFKTNAQVIQAEAKLQQYTIRIGDQTKLFISVRQPAKAHISFPKLTDTVASKVQVVSISKPDTAYDQTDRNAITVTQSYTITSFDAGNYALPAFSIGSENGVVKTNQVSLQVETVKVDTTKAIYDIKQPLAVSYTWLDWLHDNWYWIAGPLLLIALIVGLVLYMRKRPGPVPVVKVVEPAIPAHVVAINKLKELRDKKLWQEEQVKQYYIELSDIVREYLEKRYTIKTHEKTTDEILASLKRIAITDANRDNLKQLLVLSDLVKFAKEKPLPAENEGSLDAAIDFVSSTRHTDKALTTEGGGPNV